MLTSSPGCTCHV